MPAPQTATPTSPRITRRTRLGDPDVHGPLTVFPVFGPAPQLEYVSFAQAHGLGVTVKELDGGAQVNNLLVINPTNTPVLLFEGEEVLGAQQNRTFDTSVLVPARSQLQVPVSCVEAGRWDGGRATERFQPAPQAAYPELRRLKNQAVRQSVALGNEARADQGAVWAEVAARGHSMPAAPAPTGAMHDVFENSRGRLHEFCGAVRLHDGQIGALAAIGGKLTVLDHVSRPDVFAVLHGPLVQGYALDALGVGDETASMLDHADAFLEHLMTARLTEHDGIGLGRDVRFTAPGVGGAGLVAGDELVQLSAFAEDDDPRNLDPAHPATRIRRPSRRRIA